MEVMQQEKMDLWEPCREHLVLRPSSPLWGERAGGGHTGQRSLWAVAIDGPEADAREYGREWWDLGGSGRSMIPWSRLH